MHLVQLPSGNWRAIVQHKGRRMGTSHRWTPSKEPAAVRTSATTRHHTIPATAPSSTSLISPGPECVRSGGGRRHDFDRTDRGVACESAPPTLLRG